MPPPTLVTGKIAQLETALAAAVADARARDPLGPVTVLVGNVLLRPYLSRALAMRGVPQINVAYVRPNELAERMAARHDRSLRSLPRLTPAAERLLVREVAAGATGYFRDVRDRDGFVRALLRSFRELELGGFAPDFDATFPGDAKLRELSALYATYDRRRDAFATSAKHYDAAMLASFEGPLFVYGVWAPSHRQLRLIEHIASLTSVTVYLPASGTAADAAHGAFRDRLAQLGATFDAASRGETAVGTRAPANGQLSLLDATSNVPTTDARSTLELVSARLFAPQGDRIETNDVTLSNAPDTVREVWEAARACLRWADEGIRFHEMAVVYRNRDPYCALVDEIFAEAGIETYLHDGRLLSTHPLGRRVLALLELARKGTFARASVMEFLTETELPGETASQYPHLRPSEWETFTREAGVVEGIEQWRERLTRLAAEKRETAKNDGYDWLNDVADHVDEFARFAEAFHEALAARADEATWEEHLAFLRSLAERYAAGTEPIIDALDELRALSAVLETATFDAFARAVHDDLESRDTTRVLKEPVRLFGRQGVAVIDATSVRHMRFRAVYVLGLAERAWPPPRRPDPLLLEHERRAINAASADAALPLRTEPDDEPLGFWTCVQAAKEHLVTSFARADAGRSGKHLPSYFYRGLAEAIEGRRIALDALDALPNARRFAAGRLANDDIAGSLSEAEYNRGLIKAANEGTLPGAIDAVSALTPTFGRAVRARRERRSAALTAYDGVMIDSDAIAASLRLSVFARGDASVSASRLETYATCPYRYFLHYTLGLNPVEEPENIERMDHLQRGSLIHEILQKFLAEIGRADPPRAEARERHLALLMRIAREEGDERVRRGVTGRPLIWSMDKRAIDEDLVRWYDVEMKEGAASGMLPGAFEARFGPGGYGFGPEDPALSTDDPLEITVDGRAIRVQGRIDRIDWPAAGERYRVIDYKTGRNYARQADRLRGGTMLQLPLYLRAAAHLLGRDATDGEAQYFYVSSRGNFGRHVISGDELMSVQQDFERVLTTIADGVDGGYFAPNPEKHNNCNWCDYRDVCDAQINRIMTPKASDERGRAFIAIGDIS